MKIRPLEAEFHADLQTNEWRYMTKVVVSFRNFAKSHKMALYIVVCARDNY
jgi:hypothetical protein